MGIYVKRVVLNSDELYEWYSKQIPGEIYEPGSFHVTIAYSYKDPDRPVNLNHDSIVVRNPIREIHTFGEYTVMTINNVILQERFQYFMEHGCSYDYDEYRPHISIMKRPCTNTIIPFNGTIILGEEILKPLNEDNE